jgi:hypothetical protein
MFILAISAALSPGVRQPGQEADNSRLLHLYINVFTEMRCEGPYELVRFIQHSDEIRGWTSEKMELDFRKCRDISLSSLRPDLLSSNPSLLSNGHQTSPQG